MAGTGVPFLAAVTVTSTATTTRARGWDKGTLGAWLSQPSPCRPRGAKRGTLSLWHSAQLCRPWGVGAALRGPPSAPLSPSRQCQGLCGCRGHGRTGAHRCQGPRLPWVHWGAKDAQPLVFTRGFQGCRGPGHAGGARGARGPLDAGEMREIPIPAPIPAPTPMCICTGGAGSPGTPAPRMLEVPGGLGGFWGSGSCRGSRGSL